MKTNEFINRRFAVNGLEGYHYDYLPNDYDYPCYRIVLPSSDKVESVEGYYYFEVLIDENSVIRKIQRYREDFCINVELKKLPPICEKEMEHILIQISSR